MKVALAVLEVRRSRAPNLARIGEAAGQAARAGADLVLFPEAALGPFPTGRDAVRDRSHAEPVPGPATEAVGRIARRLGLHVAVGLIERDGDALYDSALLFAPDGGIVLHYRRIHCGWFYPDADRRVYRLGKALPVARAPWGRTAFLVCGDLFDDEIVDRARDLEPALLLVPIARSLEDGPPTWEREEVPAYAERVGRAGVPALLVNRADGAFVGAAMAIDAEGRVVHAVPPRRPGVHLVSFPPDP